ncbi:MAG: aldo/keto reductase [Gammaproteobacteria bacterium]
MQKRLLGSTGIAVSPIGLGTVKFGRTEGLKYPTSFQLPSDQDIHHLLSVAAELGINLIDTAPAYGTSEMRLGELLVGQRDQWVISTKAGEEFINGQSVFDFSPAAITASVERSLRSLKTDYLDVLLVHSNGDDERIIHECNVFMTLDALKQAGKIRSFGMSTKTTVGGKLTIDLADIAMVTYNSSYTDERVVIEYAKEKQKGIFVKKALGSGHLSAADNLKFVLKESGVSSVIVGTINPAHLIANVGDILK